ncbi:hypothetical protein Pla108_39290 [Botrimarina colliarenosi]|uniref:Rho termination factor N-terminal domain-containing protein n=1 Tax=Botrimarina colliarenosi TaxID=2528001 RepID=A0A5C6A200_9BACT|nr:DUF4912 domain-containing protein [Botrimarina colliarenosi]TWT93435.1 hypothetical protein Pla108_39290 [Botrimarina colliarenosi]
MSLSKLRSYTAKDLAQMARQRGFAKWHSMRKDELIAALVSVGVKEPDRSRNAPSDDAGGDAEAASQRAAAARPRRVTAAQKKLAEMQKHRKRLQDLSVTTATATVDRLLLLVRDPYWLHVTWEIAPASVARARTALGQHWHGAQPVVRIGKLSDDGSVAGTRQVKVHGGVNHWYVDVADPPSRFRAEIGYVDVSGQFYSLARSNEVQTPEAGVTEVGENAWSDVARNADKVFALSGGYSHDGPSQELRQALETRLRRPLGRPTETRFTSSAAVTDGSSLDVQLEADLVVRGATEPHTHLTIQGEPVPVREDGQFAVKLPFPDRRQVIPVVASSADGLHQRTIILGVERNTKALEPRRRDTAAS